MYEKKKDKLVILGMTTGWTDAPFEDDSFEIWGFNSLWLDDLWYASKHADLWWEIHTLETRSQMQIAKLNNNISIPVMMQERHLDIPMSEKFPLDEIVKHFGSRYFLCTFSYEIAYAIYLGFKEVHFYGINMMGGDDYIQKWNMEYWLGRAEQAGIKVVIPFDCDLLKSPKIYGYEADNTVGVYMQRYINQMDFTIRTYLMDIYNKIRYMIEKTNVLVAERPKFMFEIFHRHGLEPLREGEYSETLKEFYNKSKEPDDF